MNELSNYYQIIIYLNFQNMRVIMMKIFKLNLPEIKMIKWSKLIKIILIKILKI